MLLTVLLKPVQMHLLTTKKNTFFGKMVQLIGFFFLSIVSFLLAVSINVKNNRSTCTNLPTNHCLSVFCMHWHMPRMT